jgi:anti-sigma-K factor RskA
VERAHLSPEQADEYAIGALSPEDERLVALHLLDCDPCRDLVRSAQHVAALLSLSVPRATPPRRLRGRVFAAAGIGHWGFLRRSGAWVQAAAGLAAIVIAVAAFTGMLSVRGRLDTLRDENARLDSEVDAALSQKVEIAALSVRLNEAARENQELRWAAQSEHELLLAILSPESEAAEAISVDPDTRAIGRLVWDEQQKRVWFVAKGLAHLPPGQTYQIWVNASGRYSSLGTFSPDESGYVRWEGSIPAGIRGYDSAVVTIETAGGSPQRTGPSVFVSDLSRFYR